MSAEISSGGIDGAAAAAAVPVVTRIPAQHALPGTNAKAAAVLQYERVAARLLYAGGGKPYTLAVTSSVTGEGVSNVAMGLAVALASSTTRNVALVDANLHRPALHTMLGTPASPGLSDAVLGNEHYEWSADGEEVYGALRLDAMRTSIPNLWLVPSGGPTDHPAQVTTCEGAKTALRALKTRFGFVVIDTPPVLSAVDSASLCRVADGAVLVVRAGVTPREDILQARQLLEGVPLMGVVLNGV